MNVSVDGDSVIVGAGAGPVGGGVPVEGVPLLHATCAARKMAGSEAETRRGRERRGERQSHNIAMTSAAGTGTVRLKPDPTGLRLEPDPTGRTVVVIDREGTIRYRWVTDNALVLPDFDAAIAALRATRS